MHLFWICFFNYFVSRLAWASIRVLDFHVMLACYQVCSSMFLDNHKVIAKALIFLWTEYVKLSHPHLALFTCFNRIKSVTEQRRQNLEWGFEGHNISWRLLVLDTVRLWRSWIWWIGTMKQLLRSWRTSCLYIALRSSLSRSNLLQRDNEWQMQTTWGWCKL